MRWFRLMVMWPLGLLTMVSFQNCGKGFSSSSEIATASSQCQAKFTANALANKITTAKLNCGDWSAFACERRLFGPAIQTLTYSSQECLPNDGGCIAVNTLQFDTSAAIGGAAATQFLRGGDYNREEIRCFNELQVSGKVIIQAEGSSLAEALANTILACENAKGGT